MDFFDASLTGADDRVGNHTGPDAVGDRVGEGHQDERQEGRDSSTPVGEINIGDLGDHHETDHHQGGGDGFEGHQVDQWGEEHRQDEQQAGNH